MLRAMQGALLHAAHPKTPPQIAWLHSMHKRGTEPAMTTLTGEVDLSMSSQPVQLSPQTEAAAGAAKQHMASTAGSNQHSTS